MAITTRVWILSLNTSHGNTSIMAQVSGLEKGASCCGQASALVRGNVSYRGRWSVCWGLVTETGPILEIGQRAERSYLCSRDLDSKLTSTKSNAPYDR